MKQEVDYVEVIRQIRRMTAERDTLAEVLDKLPEENPTLAAHISAARRTARLCSERLLALATTLEEMPEYQAQKEARTPKERSER